MKRKQLVDLQKMWPDVENGSVVWEMVEQKEPSRVVAIRCSDSPYKSGNDIAQLTVRMHTVQVGFYLNRLKKFFFYFLKKRQLENIVRDLVMFQICEFHTMRLLSLEDMLIRLVILKDIHDISGKEKRFLIGKSQVCIPFFNFIFVEQDKYESIFKI